MSTKVPWKVLWWLTVAPGILIGWWLSEGASQPLRENAAVHGAFWGLLACIVLGTLWFLVAHFIAWFERKVREGVAAELTLRGVDPDREPEDATD